MFYSNTTKGFYNIDIHGGNMPDDVVEITTEYWESLLEAQLQGKEIIGDKNGYPILIDIPEVLLTYAQKRAYEYPPISEYIDGVVKGDQVQIDAYIAKCLAVKAKYPK